MRFGQNTTRYHHPLITAISRSRSAEGVTGQTLPSQTIYKMRTSRKNQDNARVQESSFFRGPYLIFGDHRLASTYVCHSLIVDSLRLTCTNPGRMRFINVKVFLEREQVMSMGGRVDRRTKVLEFGDDEATKYAILSHRWIDPTEVDYEEMIDLAKMNKKESDEIRGRLGYKKLLDTCQQAKKDGYKWVWVDTCCVDKRSSAELSEAINSMYRWYENSKICYAYLHDVRGSSLPTASDESRYPKSNGWPEWFSRGWTLQEMIAPRNLRFFNKDWQVIGDKISLARTLSYITNVPQHTLTEGLSCHRPCVAQIMSWAANRTTTRVEDRAYSLMGLLNVNMPMLYGEGKKAFHRLQLEIIRTSNDQSIFAWGRNDGQTGSILAEDPRFFKDCSSMVLMGHDDLLESLKEYISSEELPSIDRDHFGVFPITNRGIQIWILLRAYRDSDSVFKAWLPCRYNASGPPVTINLTLQNFNYYRYSSLVWQLPTEGNIQFRKVHLRYQDAYHDVAFEIDDSAITASGFVGRNEYPPELTGNTFTLTGTSPLCVRVYSQIRGQGRFAVAFGQCLGRDWVHVIVNPRGNYSRFYAGELMLKGPEQTQFGDAFSPAEFRDHIWAHHIRLPGSNSVVRTSRVVWERSRIGVRIEIFQDPGFRSGLDEWRILYVEVGKTSFTYAHIP